MSTDITDDLDSHNFNLLSITDYAEGGTTHRVYSAEERKVIDKFKDKYMEASSPSHRKNIAQLEMFPALFNHWKAEGKFYDRQATRVKSNEFLQWLRNTWRPNKQPTMTTTKQYRLGDLLWWHCRADVMKEIGMIMGIDEVDTNTPGWFEHRTTASRNILNKMSEADKSELRKLGDKILEKGMPEEIQRKNAEEKWYSRFTKAAKDNYCEMGLISFSVVCYMRKNGQLAVDIHENISDLLGIPCKSFKQMHDSKATEIMRTVHEYIKTVETSRPHGWVNGAGAGAGSAGQRILNIELDPNGHPIAPSPPSWDKITKGDLEILYRTYMTLQYRVASGISNRQAPFTRINKKQSDLIMSKYLPRGLILKDPRSMRRSEMIKFFDHVGNRQSSHGINDAFRFKAVLSSRKRGDLTNAVYKELQCTTLFNPGTDIFCDNVMPESTSQGPALGTMADIGTETALENESHQAFNIEQMTSVFAINKNTAPAHMAAPAASTTQDTDTEPAPALTPVTRSLRPRPRPIIPKKKAGDQGPAQVIMGTELAPALTEATGLVRPSPRPIQKKKAGEQACIESQSGIVVPDMASSEHPTLVLDPEYQWEPQIDLDPSLDPSFNPSDIMPQPASNLTPDPVFNTCNRAWLPTTPISPLTSFTPESANTSRRKSKKADLLAMEEAKNYMATGKRRR